MHGRREERLARAIGGAGLVACAMGVACSAPSEAPPSSELAGAELPLHGAVSGWAEASEHLRIALSDGAAVASVGPAAPSGLDAYWSIASVGSPDGPPVTATAFFYGDWVRGTHETRVAWTEDPMKLADVRALAFSEQSAGPVPEGSVVLIEHRPSGRYLALSIDHITPTGRAAPPLAEASVRWWLGAPHQHDFRLVLQSGSN